ncbi:MAG: efflux RND transporter permease subunit [Polyangiales bacterium]
MWIVRLALRRPYSVAVFCLLILIMGVLSIGSMIVDIFPTIDIPVVAVVWNYPGLSAEEMERRVVIISERAYSTTVNGIERIESSSIPGIGLMRIYFQPGSDLGAAIAQISSVSSTILRIAPPGITPPTVVSFNASNVPVCQITTSSSLLSEDRIFDYALNFIRVRLFTIPGLATPGPFGGKQRQINVDVDRRALAAKGLAPSDIVNALQTSNVILPAGSARMGQKAWDVVLNSSPTAVDQFNEMPVRVVDGRQVLLRDVAKVVDAFATQTNIVHVDGRRSVYLVILKHADASTISVVDAARKAIPGIKASAPEGLDLKVDFDQSLFVRASIQGVLREAVLSALLVASMTLVFLGSFRSVLIVCTSIPLAILTSLVGLRLTGNSINVMTLGGLALAIGMLVDDATVEVENIHRNRNLGKELTVAILDGASQIAVPAIVATLAICIVFFPVVLLTGPARFLFTPLALSVVMAMLASYLLSRTLVPVLARMLMLHEHHENPGRLNRLRERSFERLQHFYERLLSGALAHRAIVLVAALVVVVATGFLPSIIGADFFPKADAGIMKMHVRTPAGTRIEETERLVLDVEKKIREVVPPDQISTINDNIGLPVSYNLAFVQTDNTGEMDAEILISLKKGHAPTADYMRKLRRVLPDGFPGTTFYFQPADVVTQVLNFGLSAPIDIQIEGNDLTASYAIARRLRDDIRRVPGAVDVHIKQELSYPTLKLDVDRQKAALVGLSQRDVANNMLIALSSSILVSPSYFLNPKTNVNYSVVVRVPTEKIDSVPSLLSTPVTATSALVADTGTPVPSARPEAPAQTLGNLAVLRPEARPSEVTHYTVQRVVDVTADVDGRDLGSVASEIREKVAALGPLPPGMRIAVRGQDEVMRTAFGRLGLGLVLAIALVYLLMVVLYQSWLDPFIIMIAVPGALVGILWGLAITGTTINVESLMGSIMAVGIATSNSILLVSFANDYRVEAQRDGRAATPIEAALAAGRTRLRPVIMTALAMLLGMLPMALGMGEGGEQNAPLGRAVIGGLVVATFVTLFVVPVVYSLLRKSEPTKHRLEERFREESKGASAEAHA